ncbi:MAG: 2-polyprenyl-3-methyl-5-hydroxy-6-metoxy-1,4-benzoquinol methylase [uncultured bacterium]|nr:MAG: 2-polyprenyl-3-methyl-5-hydroxy-6-metoxy-1,4-benzoquinol methylase [uncultured bacterium]
MKKEFIKFLACPFCYGDLRFGRGCVEVGERVESGVLQCIRCNRRYPIDNYVPRFVDKNNYANSFGIEWNYFSKTQYDSYSGIPDSEVRFREEMRWSKSLKEEAVLEVGSGSGRFTEQVAKTGAFVVSVDYSNAVDANYSSNGKNENVLIIQGTIFNLPVKKEFFDKVFCIGVLQHTPDPEKAFYSLIKHLRVGGNIVIDVYKNTFDAYLSVRYFIRVVTKHLNPKLIFKLSSTYVDTLWPLASLMRKISPKYGPRINWALGVPDYSRRGLGGNILKEWAYLDAFDMWSPAHTHPQTLSKVRKWFENSGLGSSEVKYGYNGIEGRGTKIA